VSELVRAVGSLSRVGVLRPAARGVALQLVLNATTGDHGANVFADNECVRETEGAE
jgi:hypothetical protein